MEDLAKRLIKYFKSLGIDVYTNTKARGHQGFFLSAAGRGSRLLGGSVFQHRIDISKNTREERVVPTLLHEFTHFVHSKLEPDMLKTGGSLENIFDVFDASQVKKELMLVTHFVDENSLGQRLKAHKEQVKNRTKKFELIIKEDYPKFMRSQKFREFDKYIRKSKAKYLLKYDRVKFISPFLRREEIFSIDNLERDFPDMQPAFCAYIRMKSSQRKQAKISRRINYLEKYYSKPTELFARLVEGLYIDESRTRQVAPLACECFFKLLESGYYFELQEVFYLISGLKIEMT